MNRIQVAQRHILQGVLKRVQHSRNRQLPAVPREDLVVYLLEDDGHGRLRRKAPRDLVHGECQGYRELDDFVEQDGGRGKVAVVARRGHDSRVVHNLVPMVSASMCMSRDGFRDSFGASHTSMSAEFCSINYARACQQRLQLLPMSRRARTVSNDACFMGMPSRVGPVAILGLWAAMLGAAIVGPLVAGRSVVLVSSAPGRSNWRRRVPKIALLSRAEAPDHICEFLQKGHSFPTSLRRKIVGPMHGRVRLR